MGRVIPGVLERQPGQPENEIGLFELARDTPLAAGIAPCGDLVRSGGGHGAEEPLGEVDDLRVLDIARSRQDHARGRVLPRHEAADHLRIEAPDGVGRAEDRTPDRLAREGDLHEGVVDEIVRRILDGRVFLQDHALRGRAPRPRRRRR